ncbi:transporter, major facilitator family protein [Bifidobacterium gallicum DSM 20093 = LMG 11596]|uniref:Major facilitator transporter n=2 Tax=Bifidobacterium gallicum TaxID=78342 RepID=D1NU34_9BIFI|nr:transporter, major facilitator family protein [Bifidobacterium gallicum DSM 20093 = LMG 11596]KFI58899.1 major facilitator transporter [Bifidobacterium gallicum DSM 20093 = LMG 11596]
MSMNARRNEPSLDPLDPLDSLHSVDAMDDRAYKIENEERLATTNEHIPGFLIGSILAVGSLAFLGILTETVMTVLFPALMQEFHVDTATVQWVTTIYILVVGAIMPISSYLKRRFTSKSLFVFALATAVAGPIIMYFSTAFWMVLGARVVQGVGAGIATPLMMNIILEQSPKSKVGRLMGIGSLVITVAPAIGPTVGGALTEVMTWRQVLLLTIPILLIISLPLGLKSIRQMVAPVHAEFNLAGFVSIFVALIGLVLGVNQIGSGISHMVAGTNATTALIIGVVALLVGIASLVFFCWSSSRSFSPLLRLGWLRDPISLLHVLPYLLMPMLGIGFGYVITNLAQLGMGQSALISGLLVLPGALVGAFFAPVGGMLYDRFGARLPILVPMFVSVVGLLLMIAFATTMSPFMLAAFYFIFGVGYSLSISNIMTDGIAGIPPQFIPDGTAVFQTSLQVGGAFGMTVFSTIITVAQAGNGAEGTAAYAHATMFGGSCVFLTMLVIELIAIGCLIAAFHLRARRDGETSMDRGIQ